MFKTLAVTAVSIGLMATLSAIGAAQVASAADYPKLASVLFQLTQATDPAQFAIENHLQFARGRVQAAIELQNVQAGLDAGYHLTITAQTGNRIVTRVPVFELLRLALDSNVSLIRPIFKGDEANSYQKI
jgi:hypothetical protein